VFNPGATQLPSGETLLLVRVEDHRGISHLTAARSPDGVCDWHIDAQPTFSASPEQHPEELWGVEDPEDADTRRHTALRQAEERLATVQTIVDGPSRALDGQSAESARSYLPHTGCGSACGFHPLLMETGMTIEARLPVLRAQRQAWLVEML
jgi:hypothetical protein